MRGYSPSDIYPNPYEIFLMMLRCNRRHLYAIVWRLAMKITRKSLLAAIGAVALASAAAYAGLADNRKPVEFFTGHTHQGNETTGAPEHSGGLDRKGCHNKSVPYHCH